MLVQLICKEVQVSSLISRAHFYFGQLYNPLYEAILRAVIVHANGMVMYWLTILSLAGTCIIIIISLHNEIHKFLRWAVVKSMRILHCRSASCMSVIWDELPNQTALHSCPVSYRSCICQNLQGFNGFLLCFTAFLLPRRGRFDKPDSLNLLQEYLRTDVKTLFLCFMASLVPSAQEDWSYNSYTNGVEFRYGPSFLQLSQKGEIYEGNIVIQPSTCAATNRRTKLEFEQILMSGYPPWFKETVTNTAGITFSFPSLLDNNLKRSGWIVAVGLGDIDDPLPYFSTKFGNFKEPGWNHGRGGKGVYWVACKHLQNAVEDGFGKRLPQDTAVQAARKAINSMMDEHSAKKIADILRNSPLENADKPGELTGQLNKEDIEAAIAIFNNWPKFDDAELERLRPILVAVLAGAVRGLARIFQHLNVRSFQIHGRFEGILQINPEVYIPGP